MCFLLKRGVTVIDTATKRPGIAGRAMPAGVLPRTSRAAIERPRRRRGQFEQILHLSRRDEKGVSILEETATPPGEHAHRADRGDLAIDGRVKRAQLVCPGRLGGAGLFTHSTTLIHLDAWKSRRRSHPRYTPGRDPTPGRRIEHAPNLRAIQHFPARMARSDTGPAGPGRRCSPPSCPKKCSRRPASRPDCTAGRPSGRTSPKTRKRSGPDRQQSPRSLRAIPTRNLVLPCNKRRSECTRKQVHPGTRAIRLWACS